MRGAGRRGERRRESKSESERQRVETRIRGRGENYTEIAMGGEVARLCAGGRERASEVRGLPEDTIHKAAITRPATPFSL